MKLRRRAEPLKAVRVAVSLPGTLHADHLLYAAFYAEQYGHAISSAELIVEMLRSFIDSDTSFRSWKKTHAELQAPPVRAGSERTSVPRASSEVSRDVGRGLGAKS